MQVHARLFIDSLRHDFRCAFEDLAFVDDVDLCIDFARVSNETGFGCDGDLFGNRRELEHDVFVVRVTSGDVYSRAMTNEASAFDVELVVAGRDLFEGEAAFGVGRGCGDHSAMRVEEGNSRVLHNRAVRILYRSGDPALRLLRAGRERHCTREKAERQCY